MDKKLLALIDAIITDKFNEEIKKIEIPTPKRGLRGAKGSPGKDFSFEDHKNDIQDIISNFINDSRDVLKLKFEDLSDEDKEQLKGDKGDKGARGLKGKDGKSFIFSDHEDEIRTQLDEIIQATREQLRLKFEDLTEEEIDSLRGPKGARGQRGKGFHFEEHREDITNILFGLFEEKIDELKLKFEDLSEDERNSLKLKFEDLTEDEKELLKGVKGPRGQRGKKGSDGLSAYDVWVEAGNEGDINSYLKSLEGKQGKIGPRGAPGIEGLPGRPGIDGLSGVDAPQITDIEIVDSKDTFYLIFHFDDGTTIETNEAELPSIRTFVANYFSTMSVSTVAGATKLVLEKTASEDITAGQLIKLDSSTTASIAGVDSYVNSKAVGIALDTVTTGGTVNILCLGIHEDAGYSFTVNEPLFLQSDGSVGLTPPSTIGEFIVRIGESLGTGAIFIRIDEPTEIT
jgi:hypothetical protein